MVKKKKSIKIIVLIILVLVGGIFIVPNILAITKESCGDGSYNFKCVCGIGQVKTGFFPWKCENLPETPAEVTFPIETWEEARAYAESLLGGFECTGGFQYDNILAGTIEKQCNKVGSVITTTPNKYLGNMVMLECRSLETTDEQGIPISGQIVFSARFDPNDGFVYEVVCDDNLINCPEVTFEKKSKDNPLPECGDGCCHYGESFETCASDCEEEIPPECTAEEVNNWISLNGGQSAYGSLCANVGGTIKITGISLYEECDYVQSVCLVNDEETLKWSINSQGDCGTHKLHSYNPNIICPKI